MRRFHLAPDRWSHRPDPDRDVLSSIHMDDHLENADLDHVEDRYGYGIDD